jgi:ferritin
MLKENLSKALSDQVNAEYYSAYLYLGMSAYADNVGYKGIANWLWVQAKEELAHGNNIVKHLLERGAAPVFTDIKAPQASYGSITEVFEKILSHERHVTDLINKIADLAAAEKDHATYEFISWYVKEQIEEEANAAEIIGKIKLMGNNTGLIYHLNGELASRTFTDPFPAAAN